MMSKSRLCLILIFTSALFAFADDAVYKIDPRGGTIYPINNPYIQLLKETVIFDQSTGELTTTFIFYNTSDQPQTVTFGFPVFPVDTGDESRYDPNSKIDKKKEIEEIERKLQFRTWVDGKEVRRELWKTDTSDRFKYAFVMTLEFKPKEKKTIVNKFKQGYGYGQDVLGYKWMTISYILSTGASWKGLIKEATIIFKLNKEKDLTYTKDTLCTEDYDCYEVYNGWTFEPEPTEINYKTKEVIWKFHNFKPTFDIVLRRDSNYRHYVMKFGFIKDNLNELSKYIITKDTASFNALYDQLYYTYKHMFDVEKGYCRLAYEIYAKDLLKEANTSDPYLKAKIRHVINAFAALNGYEFSNPMWYKTFKLFPWYEPYTKNPNYSDKEKKLINDLLVLEKKSSILPTSSSPKTTIEDTSVKDVNTNLDIKQANLLLYIGLAVVAVVVLVLLFAYKRPDSKG